MKIKSSDDVAYIILKILRESGLSQNKFAKRVGVSPQTISNIVNGNAPQIGLQNVIKILTHCRYTLIARDELNTPYTY